jgi:uncharacterized membrane protein
LRVEALVKHPALVVCSFVIGVLVLGLPFIGKIEPPVIFLMLGRFHPLVLHFPIVLIILALMLELAIKFKFVPNATGLQLSLLAASAFTALVAILAGYFLFVGGEYSGELMEQHFWGATVSGAGVFFVIGLYLLSQRFTPVYPFYIGLLLLTNLSIGFTGHIGGSITHGKDYHTEYVPLIFQDEPARNKAVEEMLVYDDMISPIFQAKCMSCHNQSRSKGGLIMSSLQSITKGGDSGLALITPEDLEQSELFNRVTLPFDHDDVMPPEGQSPMSEQEIELLKYWIATGASPEQKVTALQAQPDIAGVTNELLPQLARYRRKQAIAELKLKEVTNELETVGKKLNLAIEPDSLEPGLFSLRVKFPPAPFSNDQFRELAPYNDAFSRLSIVSSSIDDDGLYHISQMTSVKKLFLQKTNIDGSGFVYLLQMPNLETLNLSFTKIDDKVALDLLKFPRLKEVYLLGTKCTPQVVEALRKNKPGLKILIEEGPYF